VLQQWRRSGKIKKRMKLKFFLNLTPVWANSGFWCLRFPYFIGRCPRRDSVYRIGSNFWKFYLIRTGFTWRELGFWWKCSDCLDRNEVFWCSECVHNVQHLIYWQGQGVRDALLIPPLYAHMNVLTPSSVYDVKTLVGKKVIWMKCNH
jgi:hypothetical protein